MITLVHTSDWHLGHRLHDVDRGPEHDRFLAWLLDLLEARAADALLITGDIFETANPPATAQRRWFSFLASARRRMPALDIVVIAGNHDSAARLEAPGPLLDGLGVHVVGTLPLDDDGLLQVDGRLLAPLTDPGGHVAAWVVAVPFLRPADLPQGEVEGVRADRRFVAGVRQVYRAGLDAARARRAGQPHALIALGHCHMRDGRVSEDSERRIPGGDDGALPLDIFDGEDVAYVALGHLHLAQTVGRASVRYAGSPIPLSLAERDYEHQVLVVSVDGSRFVGAESVLVPRTVDIIRVPEEGALSLSEALLRLAALPASTPEVQTPAPLLEVAIALDGPEPALRRDVEAALEGRHVRLARIHVTFEGDGEALADREPTITLRDLTPEQVFRRRWSRDFDSDPPADLLAAFAALVDQVGQGEVEQGQVGGGQVGRGQEP